MGKHEKTKSDLGTKSQHATKCETTKSIPKRKLSTEDALTSTYAADVQKTFEGEDQTVDTDILDSGDESIGPNLDQSPKTRVQHLRRIQSAKRQNLQLQRMPTL